LADTVRDTLAWEVTRPDDHAWRAGLTRERERELLFALRPFPGYNGDIYGEEPKMSETSALQWEIDQLVKARLFPNEQAVLRSALRALFESQPRLRRQMVVRAYIAGEISLGKAAEVLGVSHEEMKDILREEGAQIHLGPRTTDELLRDATNA
jgi:predicted HTH domain antitoxin